MSTSEFVALMLSRQALRPSGQTAWVQATLTAVKEAKRLKMGLVSSIGLQTWELVTALASHHRIPLRLVVPERNPVLAESRADWAVEQFDLSPNLLDLVFLYDYSGRLPHEKIPQVRDQRVLELADRLWPISLRPGGGMQSLIKAAIRQGKYIDDRFCTPYDRSTKKLAYSLDDISPDSPINRQADGYLIHWTRTCNTAWPDERRINYYLDVAGSREYPRSALDTLEHILKTKRIIASHRNMPGGVAVVSFSATSPEELVSLIRWRARRRQMSFEPYGLGVTQKAAEQIGLEKVNYYDKDSTDPPTGSDAWHHQSRGIITDWAAEKEYRHLGDIDLADLPANEFRLFCLLKSEAEMLSDRYGIEAVAFLE